ncbi:Nuclear pore complex protein Nup85 [Fasciola hepatica]|uniref:Nuclear pore complex protein Nup85 n=1 Tax=Fasciola hepatica TaxID=6192 RepID=A0A4E0RJ95_FASHE|nr:Nuclear pore complex protein Nup85 [Fasciola hepatica]
MDDTLYVPSKNPLGQCWGCGDRLLVYTRPQSNRSVPNSEGCIHEVRWGASMTSDEFMRRLAKTSYDVFCSVENNTDPDKFISYSVQYRASLATCSQEILQFLSKLSVLSTVSSELNEQLDEPKAMHLAAECELVQSLELIWHLAELIFVQAFPSGHLAYSLCSWFYIQSQDAADNARILIEEYGGKPTSCPENDERFWPTVLTLVLQARPHEAASVLAIHSHANSRILRSLRQILVALPIASQARTKGMWGKSGAVFSQAWNYWQSECSRRLAAGEFAHVGGDAETADQVQLIVSILSGCPTAWDDPRLVEATGGPSGWYFRFVSFLFYNDQMVTIDGIAFHLNQWLSRPSNESFSDTKTALDEVVDELIISVFRLNLQHFIRTSGEKLSTRWLVAHFTHLLHRVYPDVLYTFKNPEDTLPGASRKRTKIEETDISIQSHTNPLVASSQGTFSLADFFLIGYAESLASDPSMLYLALSYLDYCESGRAHQSAILLAHGVPTSTRAVNWLISQAKSRGLHSTSNQLAKMVARRFLPLALKSPNDVNGVGRTDNTGISCLPACSTLGWALLARNDQIVHRLSEQVLSRDTGFIQNDQSSPDLFTVPTEVAEVAAIVLGFCKDRAISIEERVDSEGMLPLSQFDSGSLITLSPELAFLVRYAELQQCFIDGNIEGAVDRLIDLLVTGSGGPGSIPVASPSESDRGGSCAKVSTRLRVRLLSEVHHLMGKQCIRRDQVELLISALIELRLELSMEQQKQKQQQTSVEQGVDLSALLAEFHVTLARELASTFLRPSRMTELTPQLNANSLF